MRFVVTNNLSCNYPNQISLEKALDIFKDATELGLDTETTGLDCLTSKLLLLQIGNLYNQVVIDINSFLEFPQILKEFLEDSSKLFILHNAKFDLQFLYRQNVFIPNVYCTFLAETILYNGFRPQRDLQYVINKYCNVLISKAERKGISEVSYLQNEILNYAAIDVEWLNVVKQKQLQRARQFDLLEAIRLDNEFVKVLAYMEYCGLKLDWDRWETKIKNTEAKLGNVEMKLRTWIKEQGYHEYFGPLDLFTGEESFTLNWNSSAQVLKVFEKHGIDCTYKGKKSVNEKALNRHRKDFPILDTYFEYKEIVKDLSTYGYNWKELINPVSKRIHTNYVQLVDTGRLASRNPNLQNLPSDEETRACFIAEEGNDFISCDYHAQEQILLANFSKEPNLIKFYQDGFDDMHSFNAFLMYPHIRRYELSELTPDKLKYIKKEFPKLRSNAKNAGFAINYGGNGSTIANNCNIPLEDGEFLYEQYFKNYPGLKDFFDKNFHTSLYNGYITYNDITKRKYFISDDNPIFKYGKLLNDYAFRHSQNFKTALNEYNKATAEFKRLSQNYPTQGSAADCTKIAGILFFNELKKKNLLFKVLLVNMVHDEICIESPEEISEEITNLLLDCMAKAGTYFCKIIPLVAEPSVGKHWIH